MGGEQPQPIILTSVIEFRVRRIPANTAGAPAPANIDYQLTKMALLGHMRDA
jgi:hypothetical protein